MLLRRYAEARFGNEVAEGGSGRQRLAATLEKRAHLLVQELERGLVADQVLLQLQQQPALVLGVERDHEAQQRRLRERDAMMPRVETGLQLLGHRPVLRIELKLRH